MKSPSPCLRFLILVGTFGAFILSVLTTISLPTIKALPIVTAISVNGQVTFGLWGSCQISSGMCKTGPLGDPYSLVGAQSPISHGLAFEPISTAVIALAFASSFRIGNDRGKMVALTLFLSLLAALLTVVALAINIATLIMLRQQLGFESAAPGISIWLNVITFVLMLSVTIALFVDGRGRRESSRRITVIEDSGKNPLTIK